jgi:hypothetical protein
MLQNLPKLFAGTNKTFTLYARDDSNVPLSLTGGTIQWRVGKGPSNPNSNWPVFTKTATITDSANGVYTVAVTPSDTQFMEGDYEHEAWLTISAVVSVVTTGRLRIRPYIVTG